MQMFNRRFLVIVLLAAMPATALMAAITGKVVDEASKQPVTQFELEILPASVPGSTEPAAAIWTGSIKDAEGKFSVPSTAAPSVVVRVKAPGYLVSDVPAAADKPVEVALKKGVVLTGKVTTEDGKPLPGVKVQYDVRSAMAVSSPKQSVTTNDKGEYSVTVEAAEKTFEFEKEGYIREQKMYRVPEKDAKLDQTLAKATSVKGMVKDDTGAPISRARVRVLWNKRAGEVREANTNDAGEFQVTLLRPGTHNIEVTKRGYAPRTVEAVTLPRKDPIAITVDRGATVTGSVVGASEEEKPWVAVYVGPVNTGINHQSKFGVLGIPPGKQVVYAEVPSEGSLRRAIPKQIEIKNGVETDVQIEMLDTPVLEGRVTEGEKAVERAVLVITSIGPSLAPPVRVVTDSLGTYRVVGLQKGKYEITVENRDLSKKQVVDVVANSTVDLSVGPRKPREDDRMQATQTAPKANPSK